MKSIFALISIVVLAGSGVQAGPALERMTQCLVRQTTGQDRIDLVRWVVMAYSRHPDVDPLVRITDDVRLSVTTRMADLVTDLLSERCLDETRSALTEEGEAVFEQAFMVVGEVAAQELMLNPDVSGEIGAFARYLDDDRLSRIFD